MEGTAEGEWTLMAEGAASMAAEAGEADWEKLRPRSTVALEEEEAAWMLSLAISKLQTQTHTHTHSTTTGQRGKEGGRTLLIVRVGTKQESKRNGGYKSIMGMLCVTKRKNN